MVFSSMTAIQAQTACTDLSLAPQINKLDDEANIDSCESYGVSTKEYYKCEAQKVADLVKGKKGKKKLRNRRLARKQIREILRMVKLAHSQEFSAKCITGSI